MRGCKWVGVAQPPFRAEPASPSVSPSLAGAPGSPWSHPEGGPDDVMEHLEDLAREQAFASVPVSPTVLHSWLHFSERLSTASLTF